MRNSLDTIWPKTIIGPTELQSSRNTTVTQEDVVDYFEDEGRDNLLISTQWVENNVYRIKKKYRLERREDISGFDGKRVDGVWQGPAQNGRGYITTQNDGDKNMVDESGHETLDKGYRQCKSLGAGRYSEFDWIWEHGDHVRDRRPIHLACVVVLTCLSPLSSGDYRFGAADLRTGDRWPRTNLILGLRNSIYVVFTVFANVIVKTCFHFKTCFNTLFNAVFYRHKACNIDRQFLNSER